MSVKDQIETESRQALDRLLKGIHSPITLNELWPTLQENPRYQDLIRDEDSWTESYRQRCWEAWSREMEKAAYGTRPYCLKCGDCCRQGSPTLFGEDRSILHQGIIRRTDLLTLRVGEIGFSSVTQDLVLLPEERIKVKEKPGTRECLFLDSATNGCPIYEDRPVQCRVMECWNPDLFQSLDTKAFLSRKELMSPDDPLVPVIETHSRRCSVSDLQNALSRLKRGFDDAQDQVLEILFYDQHLREHLDQEQGISLENQLFLLGRPVSDLIFSFGFRWEADGEGKIKVVPNNRNDDNKNPTKDEKP